MQPDWDQWRDKGTKDQRAVANKVLWRLERVRYYQAEAEKEKVTGPRSLKRKRWLEGQARRFMLEASQVVASFRQKRGDDLRL